MNISQNWAYSKKYPDGAPIFFVDGKRVSMKKGLELVAKGSLGDCWYLKKWFFDDDFENSREIFKELA